ncbi:leucine-rich repeat domain-containing protein [Prevotella loescheii]|nr:leucine-rich repeat domain-containing protein [Hoylesella loescheii]
MTSITIPNSVTSLGDWCFYDCSGLTSITIPNSVTSLGDWCFYECSGLTSITIPNSVTSLGGYCFDCCLGLTEVHANCETPPATGYDIFHACNSLQTIYVPTGASANYAINPWNAYKIVEEDVLSGITAVTVKGETVAPVYHLNGSRAGTTKSFSKQPKGIYIVNGKKVLR